MNYYISGVCQSHRVRIPVYVYLGDLLDINASCILTQSKDSGARQRGSCWVSRVQSNVARNGHDYSREKGPENLVGSRASLIALRLPV